MGEGLKQRKKERQQGIQNYNMIESEVRPREKNSDREIERQRKEKKAKQKNSRLKTDK